MNHPRPARKPVAPGFAAGRSRLNQPRPGRTNTTLEVLLDVTGCFRFTALLQNAFAAHEHLPEAVYNLLGILSGL